MSESKILLAIPTRGMLYAETVKGILEWSKYCDVRVYSGLAMPDCFNQPVQEFLAGDFTHLWFVEEDNEIVLNALDLLLAQDADVATIDYNVGGGVSHIEKKGEEILWSGLGCTLIKRHVFEALEAPWFEVDKQIDYSSGRVLRLPESTIHKKYGGHDVLFGYKLKEKGFTIKQVPGVKGKHFRAQELPKREMNKGYYTIYSL